MKAGRELDFLVSTRIMGMVSFKSALGYWFENTPDEEDVAHELPHYSTDIAAAWQVVGEMRKSGFFIYVDNAADADEHTATFNDSRDFCGEGATVAGRTAPHAICLAALKALGVEVPG